MLNHFSPLKWLKNHVFNLSLLAVTLLYLGSNTLYSSNIVLLLTAAAGVYLCSLQFARIRHWKPEQIFLLLFVPISLTFMVILPPNQAPDERSHFIRAYGLANGVFSSGTIFSLPEGIASLPSLWLKDLPSFWMQSTEQVIPSYELPTSLAIYPIVNHLPQAIGIAIANLFTDRVLVLLYAARLAAWAVTAGLLYTAIRVTPAGKWSIVLLSLFPMFLNEAISASADGLTVGVTVLFVAFVLRLAQSDRPLCVKDGWKLAALTAAVLSFKVMYAPLILLLLLIPKEKRLPLLGKKRYFVLAVALYSIAMIVLRGMNLNDGTSVGSTDTLVKDNLLAVLQNPLSYPVLTMYTLNANATWYLFTMLGSQLSWLSIEIPEMLMLGLLFSFLAMFMVEGYRRKPLHLPRCKGLLTVAVVGSIAVIFFFLMIWWTPEDALTIEGIQGRYFLPLIYPLMLIFLGNCKTSEAMDVTIQHILSMTACLLICVLAYIGV